MPKVFMLVGLPASGKSTYANELSKNENAIVLSSDALRIELYGDVENQENNGKVFQELYKRAKSLLEQEQNVIIDATNISSKRRISFTNEFKCYHKEVHYLSKSYYHCVHDDGNRGRSVGADVIERMYKSLTIPTYSEGWNSIKLINSQHNPLITKEYFQETITNEELSYNDLFGSLLLYKPFSDIYDLPHDSKWHSLSVSRHTYEVWKSIMLNYNKNDKYTMLLAAMFHDTGKAFCKNFKEGSVHANFISHENVSGQLTCDLLLRLGYDDNFILEVVELVQLHMRLLNLKDNEKGLLKLRNFVGEEVYEKLQVLREADLAAH